MIINNSGGVPLNFKVVGGSSEPANPKENTLWVNTETEITGWVFSAEAPENPAEGMVWILTATSAATFFNALKKNGLRVYPASCKQFEGGVFQSKIAKIYQSGAWKEWRNYLYNGGNECVDLSGGWSVAFSDAYGAATKKASTLYVSNTVSTVYGGLIRANRMVDLTNAKTLNAYVTACTGNGVVLAASLNTDIYKGTSAIVRMGSLGRHSLDVSKLSGSFYLYYGGNPSTGSGEVSQVWLE